MRLLLLTAPLLLFPPPRRHHQSDDAFAKTMTRYPSLNLLPPRE